MIIKHHLSFFSNIYIYTCIVRYSRNKRNEKGNAQSLHKARFPRHERIRRRSPEQNVKCREETRRAILSRLMVFLVTEAEEAAPNGPRIHRTMRLAASRRSMTNSCGMNWKEEGARKKGKKEKKAKKQEEETGVRSVSVKVSERQREFPRTITDPRNSCPTVVSHDVGEKRVTDLRAETWRDFAVWSGAEEEAAASTPRAEWSPAGWVNRSCSVPQPVRIETCSVPRLRAPSIWLRSEFGSLLCVGAN